MVNPHKIIFSDDDVADIVERYAQGDSSTTLSKKYNTTHKTILKFLKKHNIKPRPIKKSHMSEDFVYDLTNPANVYLLGLWWADGYVHKNYISHTCKWEDGILLEPILKNFGVVTIYPRKYKTPKGEINNFWSCVINDVSRCKFLMSYDYDKKSGMSACKILSDIPEKLRYLWWLGYLDGDGCINIKQKRENNVEGCVSFFSVYDQDWKFFHDMIKSLGIDSYRLRRNIISNGKSSTVTISGRDNVLLFCEYIYQNHIDGLRFDRKYEKYLQFLNYSPKHVKMKRLTKILDYRESDKKWCASIKSKILKTYELINIGHFNTIEEANFAIEKFLSENPIHVEYQKDFKNVIFV
jgi:hypothetical protein